VRVLADGGLGGHRLARDPRSTAQQVVTAFVSEGSDPRRPAEDKTFNVSFGNRDTRLRSAHGQVRVTIRPV
jgi:hypothetical protein